jgi:hypothetical protein
MMMTTKKKKKEKKTSQKRCKTKHTEKAKMNKWAASLP